MTSSTPSGVLTAILPCNNLDASEHFYRRLGFTRMDSYRPPPRKPDTYRLLSNGKGGARLDIKDTIWEGTPLGWALYGARWDG
jgi:catechol 2,3-dioxygenase-like lactoylglutathione lyase family enzyme